MSDEHQSDSEPTVDRDSSPLEPDPIDFAVGRAELFRAALPHLTEVVMIGKFEAFQCIGRGGFGVVYRARDPELDRIVAVKRCPNPLPELIERFQREAKILARFSHPNIITIHEVGWHGEDFFYAMELIEGCDGAQFITREPDWRRAVEVYEAAAIGLAVAHAKGIVHADFKPANVLIGNDGRVRVADFGLAHSFGKTNRDDPSHPWAATLPYMAPELFLGGQPNPRTDQWALCVALWETLYRCLPFNGETANALFLSILAGKALVPWGAPKVPPALLAVLLRGLSVEPTERYPSMEALIEALAEIRSPMPTPAMSSTLPASGWRSWLPYFEGAGVMLVVGLGGVLGVLGWLDRPSIDTHDAPKRHVPPPLDATETPCALGDEGVSSEDVSSEGVSSEVLDSSVVAVCQFIRDGHIGQAHEAWADEHLKRFSAGKAGLGEQTLIIARTFVEQAEAIQETRPKEARAAAQHARGWVEQAATLLGESDVVGDVRERAEVFDPAGSTTSD